MQRQDDIQDMVAVPLVYPRFNPVMSRLSERNERLVQIQVQSLLAGRKIPTDRQAAARWHEEALAGALRTYLPQSEMHCRLEHPGSTDEWAPGRPAAISRRCHPGE